MCPTWIFFSPRVITVYCVTFNNINLSEGEANALRQSLDICL